MTPPENVDRGSDPQHQGSGASGAGSPQWRGAADGVENAEGSTAYLPKVGSQRTGENMPQERVFYSSGRREEPEEERRSHTGELPAISGTAADRMFGAFESDHGPHQPVRDSGNAAKGQDNVSSGVSTGARMRPAPAAARRLGRGPRRASLQIKRFDPWSVLKLSLVLGVAMFFVWLVAVGLLYLVMDGMGVWDKLNGTYSSLVSGEGADSPTDPLISAGRVFGVAAVLGTINIVLLSALATVCAFIYNVSADLAGGLEVTLAERE